MVVCSEAEGEGKGTGKMGWGRETTVCADSETFLLVSNAFEHCKW